MAEEYFIGVDERELERLRHQHAAWDPETRALWKRAGFGTGQHIADLGSGPGFTSLELAEIVGASGRITAVDKAATFLNFLDAQAHAHALGNIRTVVTDVTTLTQIGGALDGAFTRWFLAFLIDDLDHVLQCIHRSLKPGGVVACMEYLTLEAATASPPMRGFDAHTRGWIDYYAKYGGDTSVGAYLPSKLVDAGFAINSIEAVGGMAKPSHRWWSWWRRLSEDFGEKLAEEGFMTRDEVERLEHDWRAAEADPNAFIYTPILLQVVATKRG